MCTHTHVHIHTHTHTCTHSRWLRNLFEEADSNSDGTLDIKEVLRMMRSLNVGISNKILKQKFKVGGAWG